MYGLASQIRRAAVSVPSNLSEGAARKSKQDRLRFYQIARSSLVEIDTQLEISLRLNYVKNESMDDIDKELNHIFAMLSQLIKNTRN
jgi:four helix bundle protein